VYSAGGSTLYHNFHTLSRLPFCMYNYIRQVAALLSVVAVDVTNSDRRKRL